MGFPSRKRVVQFSGSLLPVSDPRVFSGIGHLICCSHGDMRCWFVSSRRAPGHGEQWWISQMVFLGAPSILTIGYSVLVPWTVGPRADSLGDLYAWNMYLLPSSPKERVNCLGNGTLLCLYVFRIFFVSRSLWISCDKYARLQEMASKILGEMQIKSSFLHPFLHPGNFGAHALYRVFEKFMEIYV